MLRHDIFMASIYAGSAGHVIYIQTYLHTYNNIPIIKTQKSLRHEKVSPAYLRVHILRKKLFFRSGLCGRSASTTAVLSPRGVSSRNSGMESVEIDRDG